MRLSGLSVGMQENWDRLIGTFELGPVIGSGQYASVRKARLMRSCSRDGEPQGDTAPYPLAVKSIDKSKLMKLSSLQRLDTEIRIGRLLRSPHTLPIRAVNHGSNCIHLASQRFGSDLHQVRDAPECE